MVHDAGLQAYLDGAYVQVPLYATLVRVQRGLETYGSWPRASRFTCEINNDSLDYDPSRPTSLLYGVAGRNTRVRIGTAGAKLGAWTFTTGLEGWTALNGTAGHDAGAGAGTFTPNGVATALEARGTNRTGIVAGESYTLTVTVSCAVSRPVALGLIWRNGSGGFLSSTVVDVPALSAGVVARRTMTAVAPVGALQAMPLVAIGSTPPSSHVLTLYDARLDGLQRQYLYAEASSWTPERTPEHVPGTHRGRSSTQLLAEGLLRRIGTWSDPLRSPMYRTIAARSSSVGHWPLEDDRDARALSNSLPAGQLGSIVGDVVLAETESPDGAGQAVRVGAATRLAGRFAPASTTAGWQVALSFRLPAIPAVTGELLSWTTTNGYRWGLEVTPTAYRVTVVSGAGAVLLSAGNLHGTGRAPNQWITIRVKASVSAGTVTVEPAWYAQGDVTEAGGTHTFAGSVGALDQWRQDGNAAVDGGWFSHVYGVTGTADNLVGADAQRVFNGYAGETAGQRFMRVMAEQGLARYIIGGSGNSLAMGPQKPGTLLDILREIRDTDDAIIVDERFDVALTMTVRRGMYNQSPALTLTYPDDVHAYVKEIGDLGTRNRVTAKNAAGGEVTVERSSGPMSVLPPPAGVGLAAASVDVNVFDERELEPVASWHLARGTLDRPLYRSITVNLTARPDLATSALAVRESQRIRVDGLEDDPVDLLVVGMNRTTHPGVDQLEYHCEPYEPYLIGVYDSPLFRWDSRTSTLAAAVNATATAVTVTFTDRDDAWSTTAEPYEWIVAGERMTVTSMGAVTGAGPWTQTATVVRAVNGVSKPQRAGEPVHLSDAKRWGL